MKGIALPQPIKFEVVSKHILREIQRYLCHQDGHIYIKYHAVLD